MSGYATENITTENRGFQCDSCNLPTSTKWSAIAAKDVDGIPKINYQRWRSPKLERLLLANLSFSHNFDVKIV